MRVALLLLGSMLLFSSWAIGQTVSGNLEGRIIDSTGTPIPGVNVSIVGPNLIGVRGTTTGDNGLFRVLALPSGYYEVRISHVHSSRRPSLASVSPSGERSR